MVRVKPWSSRVSLIHTILLFQGLHSSTSFCRFVDESGFFRGHVGFAIYNYYRIDGDQLGQLGVQMRQYSVCQEMIVSDQSGRIPHLQQKMTITPT
jgi:hypothetical protein